MHGCRLEMSQAFYVSEGSDELLLIPRITEINSRLLKDLLQQLLASQS